MSDIEITDVPRPPKGNSVSKTQRIMTALEGTAVSGNAVLIHPTAPQTIQQLSASIAANIGRLLAGKGYRVHVKQTSDKSGLYAWADKIERQP